MSTTRIPDVPGTHGNGSLRLALSFAWLLACAGVPLHAQSYQDLYDFDCATGCTPTGTLTQGTNGNLYGTTSSGGTNNWGTIFMVSTGGAYTSLLNFDSTTGAGGGGLTLATDGNFYGTGYISSASTGTLFQFNPVTNAVTVLHQFSSTEGIPQGPPIVGKNKNYLFGVGAIPGSRAGTAYRWTISTATFELLPKPVPGFPSGPLFLASDGFMYGATANGGSMEAGALFRMSAAGTIKKLYNFLDGSDGADPNAPLTQGIKDGNLYGVAYDGGFYGGGKYGVIFEVTLPADGFGPIYQFDGTGGAAFNPGSGLLAASDGNLYGSTLHGGSDGLGTLFEFQLGGSFIPLFDFTGNGGLASGATPNGTPLMEDTNGQFYGLTPGGGANGGGVFYTMTPPNPLSHINVCCSWWVILDQPVTIVGQNLTGVISVNFGSVSAQFRHGSNTYLTAYVPSAAIDGPVSVTLATGQQLESAQSVHVLPKITNLDPSSGPVGTQVGIVGGGFAGTTEVTFSGVAATNVMVIDPGLIQATVPPGATTGQVGVVTPNGAALSRETFTVN
jgi:uncharacterized repeat protein (TIGR03803 family)